jgi:hypothetical protein
MTDSSPIRRKKYDSLDGNKAEGDPLMDTASHLPATSAHYEKGESRGHQDDLVPRRAEVLLCRAMSGQGPKDRPPPATPMATPNPYSDPFIFGATSQGCSSRDNCRNIQSCLSAERVVTLVQWVKGMREMGCTTYLEEEDVELAGHWLRKVEKGYRSVASARENLGGLWDPVVDRECPLLVGNY